MRHLLNERRQRILEFEKIARKRNYKYKPTNIPNHIFVQCENCLSALYNKDLIETNNVCPYCGHHFRIGAKERIESIVDNNSFVELFSNLESVNILKMPDYNNKLKQAKKLTNLSDAFLCGKAKLGNINIAIGVLDSNFMMGSMGSVVGEKITRLIEFANEDNIPLIIFSASGGARMQEGIFSLMQMAKTSATLNYFNNLYISVMTNPTTGGVAASFASLGDINIAEKTIKQDLPEGFQTEVFQMSKGQIDLIVERKDMRETLLKLIKFHEVIKHD